MRNLLLASFVCFVLPSAALAQTGGAVNGGLNSNSGSMMGPNINVVNGINANGTPRQQSPGASMTNGAGNSTMTPGVTGGTGGSIAIGPSAPGSGATSGTVKTAPPAQ
jgi:hypothetical protein